MLNSNTRDACRTRGCAIAPTFVVAALAALAAGAAPLPPTIAPLRAMTDAPLLGVRLRTHGSFGLTHTLQNAHTGVAIACALGRDALLLPTTMYHKHNHGAGAPFGPSADTIIDHSAWSACGRVAPVWEARRAGDARCGAAAHAGVAGAPRLRYCRLRLSVRPAAPGASWRDRDVELWEVAPELTMTHSALPARWTPQGAIDRVAPVSCAYSARVLRAAAAAAAALGGAGNYTAVHVRGGDVLGYPEFKGVRSALSAEAIARVVARATRSRADAALRSGAVYVMSNMPPAGFAALPRLLRRRVALADDLPALAPFRGAGASTYDLFAVESAIMGWAGVRVATFTPYSGLRRGTPRGGGGVNASGALDPGGFYHDALSHIRRGDGAGALCRL